MSKQPFQRRRFLQSTTGAAAAATVAPYIWTSRATAEAGIAKVDRLKIGLIGAGGMGTENLMVASPWCDVVAIADVDSSHADAANEKLSKGKAQLYKDYRKLLERKDLDAIHVATPDHWHTKPLVEAMRAGFDVYCEKPLTLTIDEGKLVRRVQKETGRIVQVGTQQRSQFELFTRAIALVAEGRVGKIKRMVAVINEAPSSPSIPVVDVPKTLDWDFWLGQAPIAEYRALPHKDGWVHTNCHYEFRWWYEYSGGKLTDWGAHHVDIAMWALRVNGQTYKTVTIGGEAKHDVRFKNGYPEQNDRYNTAVKFNLTAKIGDDVELVIASEGDNGVLIEGDKGRIFVNRGRLSGKPILDLAENPLPGDAVQKAYKQLPMQHDERKAHWANFFHSLRERVEPISDVHSHMEGLNICHLAGIAARLGREVKWDVATEQIVGDDQANSFLARECRKGYEIEG